jgi:hypothetical protein
VRKLTPHSFEIVFNTFSLLHQHLPSVSVFSLVLVMWIHVYIYYIYIWYIHIYIYIYIYTYDICHTQGAFLLPSERY